MKTRCNTILQKLNSSNLSLDRIFAALVSSVMVSYIIQMMSNNAFFELQSYYDSINFMKFWAFGAITFVILTLLTFTYKFKRLIPYTLLTTSAILTYQFASSCIYIDGGTIADKPIDGTAFFMLGLAIVDLVVILWLTQDDKLQIQKININYKTCIIAAIVLFVVTTIYFGYITSLRYFSFKTFTFDFGVFAQMFDNMAQTGQPLTTVERSYEMSHFGVHFSPIYYLLLPGYYLFRSPVYLFYAQAACVAAGVFAVYLICKKLGLSGKMTLCFEFIYCFYPALFNGCFYDFHENKMLTSIILFLFYFIISNKRIPIIILSLMLLMVKEDAAIYLIVIAIYTLINRKQYANGTIMLSMAVVYFIIANKIVASLGEEGVMMYRLSDYFVNEEETYSSVLSGVFYDIGYLIKMMFASDKIPFIIWMFLPVLFTPFATKKVSSLILLLPIIPINLMQTWRYQYHIDYQYTYGIGALIIFSAIICIKDLSRRPRHVAMLMSLIMCFSMTSCLVSSKTDMNHSYYDSVKDEYENIEQALNEIPQDATVTASHSIVPHLYFVDQLYTIPEYYGNNKEIDETDYYIVDTSLAENAQEMQNAMPADCKLIKRVSFIEIYKHN